MRLIALGLVLLSTCAWADFSTAPQVPALLSQLQAQEGFDAAQLAGVRDALKQAQFLPQLIQTERTAKEHTLTWDAYRPIAVNAHNIDNGEAFMRVNHHWLAKAEALYGVPPAVVTAILGVETKYGTYTGRARALDALATMAFRHPTRGPFFLSELEKFFVLCRDDGFAPTALKGSYAGALGAAQFMPSNYLRLAVDFDGDGKVDLWSIPDAIGSVAHYLAQYDRTRSWRRGEPLIVAARVPAVLPAGVGVNARRADTTIAALARVGVSSAHGDVLPPTLPAGFVRLDGAIRSPADWIALPNFYAVMSYNPRIFYAMAVSQLAAALADAGAGV
ncbi:MAG: lytic murein transglycosylase [Nevskiaceae bacterium]|nr:MAG: lytic murein transglycosylase [Nevskiaceae bacterium]TBR74446.1 MAG: lytic murein transglycosylase [Nevskiaceae bacterium]